MNLAPVEMLLAVVVVHDVELVYFCCDQVSLVICLHLGLPLQDLPQSSQGVNARHKVHRANEAMARGGETKYK